MNVILFHELRKRSGISARELSLKAGLSPAYVSKIESGAMSPTVHAFASLMRCLNANVYEIYFILFGEDK